MKFKTSTKLALSTASAALLVAGCAGGMSQGSGMTSAELDAVTQQVVKDSFHDKGIVKVSQVFAEDPTMKACNAADVAGQPLAPARAKEIEALNMKTIHWPANGKYLGDWKEGEKLAQSGRGRTWTDKADTPNGGNCYNCHQIDRKELSYGTIGPSLWNYGKLRGVKDLNDPKAAEVIQYTWGRLWNSHAFAACSNMPRFGHQGILDEGQIRNLMSLLLDPRSPVNQ